MNRLFLKDSAYPGLLKELAREGAVYVCAEEEGGRPRMALLSEEYGGNLGPGSIRPVEPLKVLFLPAVGNVGAYMGGETPARGEAGEIFAVGAKACDLRSLEILDHVFVEGDFKDPFYIEKRKRATIISSDCTACVDGCFCELVGLHPYPAAGYDMNLSKIKGGYIAETGSDKGEGIAGDHAKLFSPAEPSQIGEREANRAAISRAITEQAEKLEIDRDLSRIASEGFDAEVWREEAARCVECGACNFICPTCHCFILSDHEGEEGYERIKRWDACQYAGFTRVAGGASALHRRSQRLRNRYDKKLIFFPGLVGKYACTGCGRCVFACPGRIDIREVLKALSHRGKPEAS